MKANIGRKRDPFRDQTRNGERTLLSNLLKNLRGFDEVL